MKLLYDHQIFSQQRYGGISRYFCELMKRYAIAGEPTFQLACPYTSNAYLWEAPFLKLNTPVTRRPYRGSGAVNNFLARHLNRPAAVRALRQGDFDLFHPTYYDPYFLEHLGGKPFVLTVHDLTHERYPDCYPADDPTTGWKRHLCERAAHIIADSASTKNDLAAFFSVAPERVTVVHLGCSLKPSEEIHPRMKFPEQYLLYVGERGRYKNFTFAVRALAPLFREYPELRLVCVGGGPFTAEELSLFSGVQLQGRCLHYALDDGALATAYAGALALVFPSLCEGFGIPVLEAFACGCPALLADTTSLPEIGGEAALYFDPTQGEDLLCQARKLMVDLSLRTALITAGRDRVGKFNWEKTAQETHRVYSQVVSQVYGMISC